VGAGEWVAALFVVAVVYVLVRPNSQAAQLVDAFGRLLISLVQTATGANR
jgi:hypothetical protein